MMSSLTGTAFSTTTLLLSDNETDNSRFVVIYIYISVYTYSKNLALVLKIGIAGSHWYGAGTGD